MGLFGFLKKDTSNSSKTGANTQNSVSTMQSPANVKGLSSTKVNDEHTSFEIPDFTEEDLNFDLGLNEFVQVKEDVDKSMKIPQSQTHDLPKAKMTPKEEQDSEQKNDPFEGMVINVNELNTGSLIDVAGKKVSSGMGDSKKETPLKKPELVPEKLEDEEFSIMDFNEKENDSSEGSSQIAKNKETNNPFQTHKSAEITPPKKEEILPKFDVKPSLNLEKERHKNNGTFGDYIKSNKSRTDTKKEAPSLAEIKSQKYGLPNEVDKKGDIFIDKRKYKNMIIVADLVKEEVELMLDVDLKLVQKIETVQDYAEELSQHLDFIKESILKIDKKIFEEGEQ